MEASVSHTIIIVAYSLLQAHFKTKCPRARYRTPNCSRRLRHWCVNAYEWLAPQTDERLAWQLMPSVYE